jgi:hypothetical protein
MQARVIIRGHVFRDYGRLPGVRGYLGGEVFMRLEDLKANCRREWTCNTVLRDYDSVCNNSGGAIGNWWSGGKSWSWCGGREYCASVVQWMRQNSVISNST